MSGELIPEPPPDDLDALAQRINHEHEQCEAAARAALDHAMEAGRFLAHAKVVVGHGKWLDWVRDNCRFSERLMRYYIQVWEGRDQLEPYRQRVADLSLRGAVAYLTPPRAPKALPEPAKSPTAAPTPPPAPAPQPTPPVSQPSAGTVVSTPPALEGEVIAEQPAWAEEYEVVTTVEVRERVGSEGAICTHCGAVEDLDKYGDSSEWYWPLLCGDCEEAYDAEQEEQDEEARFVAQIEEQLDASGNGGVRFWYNAEERSFVVPTNVGYARGALFSAAKALRAAGRWIEGAKWALEQPGVPYWSEYFAHDLQSGRTEWGAGKNYDRVADQLDEMSRALDARMRAFCVGLSEEDAQFANEVMFNAGAENAAN